MKKSSEGAKDFWSKIRPDLEEITSQQHVRDRGKFYGVKPTAIQGAEPLWENFFRTSISTSYIHSYQIWHNNWTRQDDNFQQSTSQPIFRIFASCLQAKTYIYYTRTKHRCRWLTGTLSSSIWQVRPSHCSLQACSLTHTMSYTLMSIKVNMTLHHDACLPPRRKEVMKWLDMFEKQRNKDVGVMRTVRFVFTIFEICGLFKKCVGVRLCSGKIV